MTETEFYESKRSGNELYREYANALCLLFAKQDIFATPFHDPLLPHFARLPAMRQDDVLSSLKAQLRVMSLFVTSDESLLDPWEVTRAVLNDLEITLAPDLPQYLAFDDFVAAYDKNHTMIYLSPNHMRFLSHSLEHLYCRPWMELVSRAEQIQKVIAERAFGFAQGKFDSTKSNQDVPPHVLTEINSPKRISGTCRSKAYSPLYKRGRHFGFLSINQISLGTCRVMPRPEIKH